MLLMAAVEAMPIAAAICFGSDGPADTPARHRVRLRAGANRHDALWIKCCRAEMLAGVNQLVVALVRENPQITLLRELDQPFDRLTAEDGASRIGRES